jgi:hypothetical protein
MKRLRAGDRLELRFDLHVRAPGRAWERLDYEGLGIWNRADENVARYRYTKRIENLTAPASYRAVVSFRWRNAAGRVTKRAKAKTPVCAQPDLRTDLRVGTIEALRTGQRTATYTVMLRNAGKTAAPETQATMSVDGVALAPQPVAALAPGASTALRFSGPACEKSVEARVDTTSAVA